MRKWGGEKTGKRVNAPMNRLTPPAATCRPSGALGCLVYATCYKHAALLGLNTSTHQNSRHGIHRRGEVSSPDGLGNPTPTHPILLRVFNPANLLILSILIQTNGTYRPAGAKCTNSTQIRRPALIVGAR